MEYLLIFLLTSYLYLSKIDQIKFHGDESTWITTSLYFDELTKGNINSPIWDPGYWTLTTPPVTRYIIGISRKLNDIGPEKLNKVWDFSKDKETNIQLGAMPSPELLKIARTPMTIMAIFSILLVFYCTRKYMGILVSYTLFILIISNNYFTLHLSRAMSESPLLLFIILVMILLYFTVRLWMSYDKPIFKNKKNLITLTLSISLIGIMIGTAGGIKLNGFALLGVSILLYVLLLFFSHYLNNISVKARVLLLSSIVGILTFTSFTTFIASNPFLYKNTIDRSVALFKWRIHEMDFQTNESKSVDLTSLDFTKRVLRVGSNIFNKYSSISFKGASLLNFLLFLTGFIIVVRKSMEFLKGNKSNLCYLTLLLTLIIVAGPSLLTPLDWDRYFYLPVFFSTILISIGIAEILRFIYMNSRIQNLTILHHGRS
ncbi:MAG: hypothetical protein IID03_05735 [Candidatus Dadabacteria bacterium]|nr:hypothetical protein [Candidatus Dadabacteria bacterium]